VKTLRPAALFRLSLRRRPKNDYPHHRKPVPPHNAREYDFQPERNGISPPLCSLPEGLSRDDRGASFVSLVTALSAYQLRTHYTVSVYQGISSASANYSVVLNGPVAGVTVPVTLGTAGSVGFVSNTAGAMEDDTAYVATGALSATESLVTNIPLPAGKANWCSY
jgi:hypothetical protein